MLRYVNVRTRSPHSPGVGGYALAILIALVTLALGIALVDGLVNGTGDFSWGVVVVVVVVGVIPAAVIGSLGAVIVHFTTRGVAGQGWHVLAAASAGVVAGALVSRDFSLALLLGVGTGLGRLAVSHARFRGQVG